MCTPTLVFGLFLLLGKVLELIHCSQCLIMKHKVQRHCCAMYPKQIVLFPFCFRIFHILWICCLSMACATQSLIRLEGQKLLLLSHLLRKTICCDGTFCSSTWVEDSPRCVPLRCTRDVYPLLSPKTCFLEAQRSILHSLQPLPPCLLICQENRKILFLQARVTCAVISSIMDIGVLSYQF